MKLQHTKKKNSKYPFFYGFSLSSKTTLKPGQQLTAAAAAERRLVFCSYSWWWRWAAEQHQPKSGSPSKHS
jgi:hypothetical protein